MRENTKGNINFFLFSPGTERQNNAAATEKKIEMGNIIMEFITELLGDRYSRMCHLYRMGKVAMNG